MSTSTAFTIGLGQELTPAAAIASLGGSWEGWAAFGAERYEILLTIGKGSGRLETREHRSLKHTRLEGELKGAALTARFANYRKLRGVGTIRAGKAREKGWDTALLLSVNGRPSQQVLLKRLGKSLRLRWQDLQRPGLGPVETELKATARKAL